MIAIVNITQPCEPESDDTAPDEDWMLPE